MKRKCGEVMKDREIHRIALVAERKHFRKDISLHHIASITCCNETKIANRALNYCTQDRHKKNAYDTMPSKDSHRTTLSCCL
jgi:hypothetical protein